MELGYVVATSQGDICMSTHLEEMHEEAQTYALEVCKVDPVIVIVRLRKCSAANLTADYRDSIMIKDRSDHNGLIQPLHEMQHIAVYQTGFWHSSCRRQTSLVAASSDGTTHV